MDFPDWESLEQALNYDAVKLFMQNALRAKPDFMLLADDLKFLAQICRLVAGMPLGIVLTAAWVSMLSLEEIADEIAGHAEDFPGVKIVEYTRRGLFGKNLIGGSETVRLAKSWSFGSIRCRRRGRCSRRSLAGGQSTSKICPSGSWEATWIGNGSRW